MLEEVSRLLAQNGSSGSFVARRTAAAKNFNLEVQGVGRIRFPVFPTTARKLAEVARPALHGFKDQTRLDRRVRDTWEIPKSRITIDELKWKKTLTPQLDRIRRDLGLPKGCRLKAQLHNLLVYGPGQFFATHRDSEKAYDMIGFLTADTANEPLTRLRLSLLRAAHDRHRADKLRSPGLKPVHARCSDDLTTRLNAPPRAKDDWSIMTSVRCSCKLCATLTRYLRAPDRVRFEWPLAKTQRAHVHGILDSCDLPVHHTTRRTGRPFTLMLEKTAAVFERAATDRRSWQNDLQWLKGTTADF